MWRKRLVLAKGTGGEGRSRGVEIDRGKLFYKPIRVHCMAQGTMFYDKL